MAFAGFCLSFCLFSEGRWTVRPLAGILQAVFLSPSLFGPLAPGMLGYTFIFIRVSVLERGASFLFQSVRGSDVSVSSFLSTWDPFIGKAFLPTVPGTRADRMGSD